MFRFRWQLLLIGLAFWGCEEKGKMPEEVDLWGKIYLVEETDTLNLFGNQLSGFIPSEIGKLTNLTHLYLHSNSLTGEIPEEIGELTNLTNLSLSFNTLTGGIPSSMKNLTNLYYLNLGFNSLSGELPEFFCDSPYLYIIYNKFCPPYPPCIEDYVGQQDTINCK